MSEPGKLNHDDLLDRAARALSETCVPDGPPASVVEALLAAAGAEANLPKPPTFKRRILTMKSIIRTAVAVSVLLVLGLGLLAIFTQSGPKLAFAEVADTFLNIRTARCRMTFRFEGSGAEKGPTAQMAKLMEGSTADVLFMAPASQRTEMEIKNPAMAKAMKMIQIMDMDQGKFLQLMPSEKMAMVMKYENMPENQKSSVNSYLSIRQFVANARRQEGDVNVEALGEKTLEGQPVSGFSVTSGMGQTEFWANSKTGLPVRVEVAMAPGVIAEAKIRIVMSDFQTGIDLDKSLFSTEAPEGYTVQEMKMDMSPPTLTDLRRTLRFLAKRNKDMFPDELPGPKDNARLVQMLTKQVTKDVVNRMMKQAKKGDKSKPVKPEMEPGQMQAMMDKYTPLMRGIMFTQTLKKSDDWHYAGKGVKLNASDVPIFWYKPAGSEKYKVLYADLTVKELAKDPLPPQTEPRP